MSDTQWSASNSPGLLGWLGIVFIVLKLTGVIDWSWWLVTLPIWGGVVIFFLIVVPFAVFFGHKILKLERRD